MRTWRSLREALFSTAWFRLKTDGRLRLGRMRFEFFQSDLMGDVLELGAADFFQPFAAGLELFVDLDGLLGHVLMRVLGTADQREIFTRGDAFTSIRIQTEAENLGFAFLFGVGHAPN